MVPETGKYPHPELHEVVSGLMLRDVRNFTQLVDNLQASGADAGKVLNALEDYEKFNKSGVTDNALRREANLTFVKAVRGASSHPLETRRIVQHFIKEREYLYESALFHSEASPQTFAEAFNARAPELIPQFQRQVQQERDDLMRSLGFTVRKTAANDAVTEPLHASSANASETAAGGKIEEALSKAETKLTKTSRAGLATAAVAATFGSVQMLRSSGEKKDDTGTVQHEGSAFKKVAGVALLAVAAVTTAAAIRGEHPVDTAKKTFEATTSWIKKVKVKERVANAATQSSNSL